MFVTMGIAGADAGLSVSREDACNHGDSCRFKEEHIRRNWQRTGAVTLKKGLHLFCRIRKHNKNGDREQRSVM